MPDRSRKTPPTDPNELATFVVAQAKEEPAPAERQKDPAAVSLGRRGGLKGGKARAEALTPERRSEIARNAAKARFGPKK